MKVWPLILILPFVTNCSSPRPTNLGLINEGSLQVLRKCPESPNCISSHNPEDKDHYLEPLKYESSKEDAKGLILRILKNTPNAKVISNDSDYIHAEFTSSIFRFVDDVEFNFTESSKVHFRSASRLGHSDLGANKKRMGKISFRFYQNDM